MRANKNLLLAFIILFCVSLSLSVSYSFSANIQEDEIVIKSITPVYDENSTIVVNQNNDKNEVIFNDKNQNIKYNIVIENISDYDVKTNSIELTTPTEEFLNYKLEGINKDDVLKSKETKDLVISFETTGIEGWGRNFNDELITSITFDKQNKSGVLENIINPNTSDKGTVIISWLVTCFVGFILILRSKKKVARYTIPIIALSTILTIVKAQDLIVVQIKINVAFDTPNVMKTSYILDENENLVFVDYWKYTSYIKNFYIENEFSEITNYAYKFDVSEKQNEKVIAYLVLNDEDASYYDLHLQADGIIYPNTDASYYFGMENLSRIDNVEGLDTSNVTNMTAMFCGVGRNSSVFILDLRSFDTSNVTSMEGMFALAGENSDTLELDLSSFDTSNVTNMNGMFLSTGYNSSTFTLDVINFDTSNVTNMSMMFRNTGHNNPNFTLDVSNFDTSNVTDMSYMFSGTGLNTKNFILDLSNFNTSNVTNMYRMFDQTGYNSEVLTLDLGNFDTSNETNMSGMFYQTGYNSEVLTLNLSNFDTSNVTNMSDMFYQTGYNSETLTLDLSNFDTSNVTNMSDMFYQTGYSNPNFTLDVSNFDTSKVANMSYMFYQTGYSNPNFTIDVSNFDTSKVVNMSYMFYQTGYNSSKLNTSITIMRKSASYSKMFENVATQKGAQITVNYTSSASSLVDKMIATKSSNSNVVKGEEVIINNTDTSTE